eukprot:2657046-Pyramimonas_sp.AAC.1
MMWLRGRKATAWAERAKAVADSERDSCAIAWNAAVVRAGGMFATRPVILLLAWKQIGNDACDRDDVRGTSHGLAIVSAVGAAIDRGQRELRSRHVSDLLTAEAVPAIQR